MKKIMALLLLLSSTNLHAEVHVYGAGINCKNWDQSESHQIGFLLGVLSGMAMNANPKSDPLNGLGSDAPIVWVTRYCRKNPQESITNAASEFFKELK